MILTAHQFQIFNPVIGFDSVLMVNEFGLQKRSSQVTRHDKAVFKTPAGFMGHYPKRVIRVNNDADIPAYLVHFAASSGSFIHSFATAT